MRFKLWDKHTSIITPAGQVVSARDWIMKYPIAGLEDANMVIADEYVNGSIFIEYNMFIKNYKMIDFTGLTPEQGIEKINEYEETPKPTPSPEPTPYVPSNNERIAAALEALVILQM